MKCLRFVLPILAAWALGGAIAPAFATTLGQFDPAFNGGTPATLFDGDGNEIDAVAAAINPVNGDILWAGSGGSAPTHGGIVAYKPDGTVDSSVGSDGLILVSPTAVNYPSDNLVLTDIAVDGAGRILVSGIVKDTNNILLLARFNPDGSPDTGFGTAGTGFVVVAPSESAASGHDLALTADGHIMVVGVVSTGGTRKVAVWQFGPDGTIDADFGDAGHVRVDSLDGFALVFGCASVLEPNAELIIACRMGAGGFKIVRLHADGSPDTAFGDDGLVSVGSQYMNSLSLALVPGGGLAVAYSYHDIAGTLRYLTRLRRYLPDGSPDPGFNDGSAVTVTNTTTGCVVEVAAQPDGKLLLTTNCFFSGDILLARVLPDGSLDAAFGTDSFPGFADVGSFSAAGLFGPIPMAIAIQADGRIVIVGNADNSSSVSGIFTTRLLNDAFDLTPDTPAFDAVGRASLDQAVVSNAVTLGSVSIGDETDGIALALMVKGGQYSTTGSDGPFTGDAGSSNIAWIGAGDSLALEQMTSNSGGTDTTTQVTIGGFWAPNNYTIPIGSPAAAHWTTTTDQPPVAHDGTLKVTAGKVAKGTLDIDNPSGGTLTYGIVAKPGHGKVDLNTATGAYTFTPVSGYAGKDSFTFKANDGVADSNIAKVSVAVTAADSGTNRPAPPAPNNGGSGGGGAFGWLAFTLIGLAGLRRKCNLVTSSGDHHE